MDISSGETWPRDNLADENPEMTRKRQRLSEDTETSPMSGNGSSSIVDAQPPDEGGTGIHNAIELPDDEIDMVSTSFTDQFNLDPAHNHNLAPSQQLQVVLNHLSKSNYIEPAYFIHLSTWLREHLETTKGQSLDVWYDKYSDEYEFFSKLADLSVNILSHGGRLFETIPTNILGELKDRVHDFVNDLATLSTRIVFILPQVIDHTISRRDSRQDKSRQTVQFLWYTQILAQVLVQYEVKTHYLIDTLGLKPGLTANTQRDKFWHHSSAISALTSLLQKLGESHSGIDNVWNAIDAILRILSSMYAEKDIVAVAETDQAMATIHRCLLPAALQTSPRDLPYEFHEFLITTACKMIAFLAKHADADQSADLYNKYIRNDDKNALLTDFDRLDGSSVATQLKDQSKSDPDTLVGLLRTAWKLQKLKDYIKSSIMGVRTSGILQLSKLLLQLYNVLKMSSDGFHHPILQYVGRFIRANGLTDYIFSSKSHASLISHSQNIIGFLAATFLYTNNETDVIWKACTTSVEAEFVKASFGVLTELCRYLDLEHLLYLAEKYPKTEPDQLGKDAVETLTDLFQKVQLKSIDTNDQEHRLKTAIVSIDLLYKIKTAENTFAMAQLRDTARAELLRFAVAPYNADDRVLIYKHFIPNLINPDNRTTTSIEILLLFLDSELVCRNEPQYLLSMLTVDTLVDELSNYVDGRKDGAQEENATMSAFQSRLIAIVRLQALPGASRITPTWNKFFDYATGKLAISNAARDCAWQMLKNMGALEDNLGSVAGALLRHCLQAAISPPLPLEFLTPTLLNFFGHELLRKSKDTSLIEDYSLVLQDPVWQVLMRTAESTSHPEASSIARNIICDVLFEYPRMYSEKSKVAKCHADFAKDRIRDICQKFQALPHPVTLNEKEEVVKKIDLLAEVFTRSKLSRAAFEQKTVSYVSLLATDSDATDPEARVIHSILQVYGGGQIHPKLYQLDFSASSKLSELASKLPEITGADTSRVIIGGQEVDLGKQANQTMAQLGVGDEPRSSGVILICPKHTFQSDIGKLLTSVGEVEQELLAQYDELEQLLDGPTDIAEKMFNFITGIRPPARPRQHVEANELSARELFPLDNVWRSAFNLHVLLTHFQDYANIGVADETFRLHGVDLLVNIITDETRQIDSVVFGKAMRCLVHFLQEQPSTSTTATLIERPSAFVSRMVDICFFFLPAQTAVRHTMIDLAFQVLIAAFRCQPSVWQTFTEDLRVSDMHQQVFMHSDTSLVMIVTGKIKAYCMDPASADDVTGYFMNTGLAMIPHALKHNIPATHFFALVKDTLLAYKLLQSDETKSREVCQTLITALQSNEHSESVELPVADVTVAGLLKLLIEAINVVRSFKKPLKMDGLAVSVFTTLLFPPLKDHRSRPLVDHDSRSLAYEIVRKTCETSAEFSRLLEATSLSMQDTQNNPQQVFPGVLGWLRKASDCSGLTNLGNTCYMNSLLQQLFANVHFRKFIFEVPIIDRSKQELLYHVQHLFARMQDDYQPISDTSDLAKALGTVIGDQEDVHEFYKGFLSQVESNMPDDKWKRELNQFFSGTLITQIRGDLKECGHVSNRTEPFVELTMVMKDKPTLLDSLQEFVQGEPMEGTNKYKCLVCDPADGNGRLVDARRRACPDHIPQNLTFCLKRFSFGLMDGEFKVNDRFEFPQTIDMSRWRLSYLDNPKAGTEEDLFELVGVIVHQGSLNSGHYWSYTLLRSTGDPESRTWVRLEDRNVTTCSKGIADVQRQCFGGFLDNGNERTDNAYVLFYQRKGFLEEQISMPGPVQNLALPPKVAIPDGFQESISENNKWRNRIAHLFDDAFQNHVEWLLSRYDLLSPRLSPQSDIDSVLDEDGVFPAPGPAHEQAVKDFAKRMCEVATIYVQRVATCDHKADERLRSSIITLKPLIAAHPWFASCLLDHMAQDSFWLNGVVTHRNFKISEKIYELLHNCLLGVREHGDETLYRDAFNRIKDAHSAVKDTIDPALLDWAFYLNFAADLARLGSWEMASILDSGYLSWTFQILYSPAPPGQKQKFQGLLDYKHKHPSQVSALFAFLCRILDGGVVFPQKGYHYPDGHQVIADCVVLKPSEAYLLIPSQGEAGWMPCAKLAVYTCDWKDFAPGRLLDLLMSSKSPIRDVVAQSIEEYFKNEVEVLDSVCHLLLHFCINRTDQQAFTAFNELARTIHLWPEAEKTWIHVVREAHKFRPLTVVKSIEHWCEKYLKSPKATAREATEKWLREAVFEPDPISDSENLDASRIRQTRKLSQNCAIFVTAAYKKRQVSRKRCESSINTMKAAEEYLKKAQMAGKVRAQSADEAVRASISYSLSIELGELAPVLDELKTCLVLVKDWKDNASAFPEARLQVDNETDYTTDSEAYEDVDDEGVSPR